MKKIVSMLLATVAIASCSKKEPHSEPIKPVEPKLSYISKIELINKLDNSKYYEIDYKYDAQMRLASFTEKHILLERVTDGRFKYTDKQIELEYDEHKHHENVLNPTHIRLSLDGQGKATRLDEEIHWDTGVANRVEQNYKFNHMGAQLSYGANMYHQVTSVWLSGNQVQTTYVGEGQKLIEEKQYTNIPNRVYPDLNLYLNKMSLATEFKYLWANALGLHSEHLLESVVSDNGSGSKQKNSYLYQLDSKGRPTKITVLSKEDGDYFVVISYKEA